MLRRHIVSTVLPFRTVSTDRCEEIREVPLQLRKEIIAEFGGRVPESEALDVVWKQVTRITVNHCGYIRTNWSQFVPNMSTDIRRHEALLHHQG